MDNVDKEKKRLIVRNLSSGETVVTVEDNSLDLLNAGDIHRALSQATEKMDKVVIDLSNIEYIDSSGISALVNVLAGGEAVNQGRKTRFALANVNERQKMIFRLTGLDALFPVVDRLDEAIRALEEDVELPSAS